VLKQAAADSPKAAKEVLRVSDGSAAGTIRPTRRSDDIYRLFRLEAGRHAAYRDYWEMIEESPLIEHALWSLVQDATGQLFDIECGDARAKDEIWRLLERVHYYDLRDEYLFRTNGIGDLFALVDIEWQSPSRKWNLGEIVGLRIAPEYQMFRLQDARGFITDLTKAFKQLPGIDWIEQGFEGSFQPEVRPDGTFLYAGGAWAYAGLAGQAAAKRLGLLGGEEILFSAEQVIHARLNPTAKPIQDGYGVSILRSKRVTHNIVMMCLQDMAIGRKGTTYNREAHILPKGTTTTQKAEYEKKLNEQEAGPNSRYTIIDGEIKLLDARNWQLKELGDLWLAMDLVTNRIYPVALTGFGAERFSGELLGEMAQWANAAIGWQHRVEEYQILRPLIDRQMWMSGKADVAYDVVWPAEVRLEDMQKKSKRTISEVQTGISSRKRAMRVLYQMEDPESEQEIQQIKKELEEIGPPGHYTAPPESLNKGKKGVEKKPPETQDIAPTEGTEG